MNKTIFLAALVCTAVIAAIGLLAPDTPILPVFCGTCTAGAVIVTVLNLKKKEGK